MKPQIDFIHVLNELSVNRNDPCEIVRELISNAYDAKASKIRLAALQNHKGLVFFDNGSGLCRHNEINGITPYSAFFSIGKSTKRKGDGGIGYKCQGSKLCFASGRVLILTKTEADKKWLYKIIESPRKNLSTEYPISPEETSSPEKIFTDFLSSRDAQTHKVISTFDETFFKANSTGTLIAVMDFDTDGFSKYFSPSPRPEESYIYNYIRHYTRIGDITHITKQQGFSPSEIRQVATRKEIADFELWDGQKYITIPHGFPYLDAGVSKDIKDPLEVTRLRDGRFFARSAKKIIHSSKTYSFIIAVDGNRRAHDGYEYLDRKGATKSGIRLSDQRGVWISSNGIKICKFNELLLKPSLSDYSVLYDSESSSHYHLIIDGDFELVTNRNSISRSNASSIDDSAFLDEIKKFLDAFKASNQTFRNLLTRLRREQSNAKLDQQIENLEQTKLEMKARERFDIGGVRYVSPLPGEEYLVGVLYAELWHRTPPSNPMSDYWKRVLTFSTLGIDSIGTKDGKSLKADDLIAIEYKFNFSNSGPFNHALCIVDFIIAWEVELTAGEQIKDDYGCFGDIKELSPGYYEIHNINHSEGNSYDGHIIKVVSLKRLIADSFPGTKFIRPPQ